MTHLLANWKMNGDRHHWQHWLQTLLQSEETHVFLQKHAMTLAPPLVWITDIKRKIETTTISVFAQHVSRYAGYGAYTGHTSAALLREAGCSGVLIGHSERRRYDQETQEDHQQQIIHASSASLTCVFCVGETRPNDDYALVLKHQLSVLRDMPVLCSSQIWVAYEPVWSIGTGLTPDLKHVQNVTQIIRDEMHALTSTPPKILYGGSVDHEVVSKWLTQVDGFLIGSSSLDIHRWLDIVKAVNQTG